MYVLVVLIMRDIVSLLTNRWSVAALMLVCHMVMMIDGDYTRKKFGKLRLPLVRSRLVTVAMFHLLHVCQMLAAPYIAYFAFSLPTLIVSKPLLLHTSHSTNGICSFLSNTRIKWLDTDDFFTAR